MSTKRREPPARPARYAAEPAEEILATLLFFQKAPRATARRTYSMCAYILQQRERPSAGNTPTTADGPKPGP